MSKRSSTDTIEASTTDDMAKVRLVVMIEDDVRDALRVESAVSKTEMSTIVESLLREKLSDAMDKVKVRRAQEQKAKGGK